MKYVYGKLAYFAVAVAAAAVFGAAGCSEDPVTPAQTVFEITQAQLNASVNINAVSDTAIIGDPFKSFVNPPKFNDTTTRDQKIRDLFTSLTAGKSIAPGAIFVRKKFDHAGGKVRGALNDIVIMVKREAGYFPDGKDFEYMKFTPATSGLKDVSLQLYPNGLLPPVSDTLQRGKSATVFAKCISCHADAPAGDFIYSR